MIKGQNCRLNNNVKNYTPRFCLVWGRGLGAGAGIHAYNKASVSAPSNGQRAKLAVGTIDQPDLLRSLR